MNSLRPPRRVAAVSVVAGLLAAAAIGPAAAATVALHQDAVTALVARRLFTDGGRRVLAGSLSSCNYAMVERPSVTFRGGRMVLRLQFSGRAGLMMNGTCAGGAESFPATVSGEPFANGDSIGVRDVRVEEGKKEYRNLLEPLLKRQLPALLGSNLRNELALYLDTNVPDIKLTVTDFHLHQVAATDGALTVRFDFAVQGIRR